ncbi:outer membrane beta-barrel protein [Elizabethkingia anophelis]|uniref:Outer membrane protein beta-barrel domain-containing protein n=1 Tax=Elizabethkingia anophelis TaxID=1117645 RepID=A0AAU8VH48_9FLAO|nr:outer membrane beta-barrel protein [Elizabethkingia anophelis]AQX02251.1 hypothetical protein BBD32_12680 [Elizabethkingia anophelis]OPB63771.1 hypothetical protein BAY11_16850 [Elizabethkingia anophelis]
MKKRLSVVFFLVVQGFCFVLQAQQGSLRIELDVGSSYSLLRSDMSSLVSSKYSGMRGFGVNSSLEYEFLNKLFVSGGVSYLERNYKFSRTGVYQGWYTDYHNSYLVFPLRLGGYFLGGGNKGRGIWLKGSVGLYSDYWLSMRRVGRYPVLGEEQLDGSLDYRESSDRYDFKGNESQLRRFGYGWEVRGSVGYEFKALGVYIGYQYQGGLSDQSKTSEGTRDKSRVESYMFSLGVGYRFK